MFDPSIATEKPATFRIIGREDLQYPNSPHVLSLVRALKESPKTPLLLLVTPGMLCERAFTESGVLAFVFEKSYTLRYTPSGMSESSWLSDLLSQRFRRAFGRISFFVQAPEVFEVSGEVDVPKLMDDSGVVRKLYCVATGASLNEAIQNYEEMSTSMQFSSRSPFSDFGFNPWDSGSFGI